MSEQLDRIEKLVSTLVDNNQKIMKRIESQENLTIQLINMVADVKRVLNE